MYSESSSEELSNPISQLKKNNRSCPVCHLKISKSSDTFTECLICNEKVCESCSVLTTTCSKRQCNRCMKYLSYLSPVTLQQLQCEVLTNSELSAKFSALQQELKETQMKNNELEAEYSKIDEKKALNDALRQELMENIKKIHECTLETKALTIENNEITDFLSKEDEKIEKLSIELEKVKSELLESRKNSNFIPADCGELYVENQELKARIKDIEQENLLYTQQMIDALELLKLQLDNERSENLDLKQMIETSTSDDGLDNLEAEKKNIRELQEELKIAKKQLELMRGSRIEEGGFHTDPKEEDPESTPCKCTVY